MGFFYGPTRRWADPPIAFESSLSLNQQTARLNPKTTKNAKNKNPAVATGGETGRWQKNFPI